MAYAMVPIYTQTVGAGGVSSVTFNNIPSTYNDLKVVISARGTSAVTQGAMGFFVNGNNSLGSFTNLYGTGSGTGSSRASGYMDIASTPAASATANTFGSIEIYIPNYCGSAFKQIISDTVNEHNATAIDQSLRSVLWRDTSAINKIEFTTAVTNFAQYSTFTLYGIKNA